MMGVKQTMKVDETETSSQLYLFSAVSQLPVVRSEHARKPLIVLHLGNQNLRTAHPRCPPKKRSHPNNQVLNCPEVDMVRFG